MALTELAVRQAKPSAREYSMSDGKGLLLVVKPSGKKYWILRYWKDGKEHRTSVGAFPDVSLKDARTRNFEFRKALGTATDSRSVRLGTVVDEWMRHIAVPKFSPSYLRTVRLRLEKYLLPEFRSCLMDEITPGAVLALCRRIEATGNVDTANRVRQLLGQIFRYAIAAGQASGDPTSPLRGALLTPAKRHYAALTDPFRIGLLMRAIDAYPQTLLRCALKVSALTFCRPGEIRHAEWNEISGNTWKIPAEKMKMSRPHIVPLARQTMEALDEARAHSGAGKWIFPSARRDGRPMSENAVRMALRSMGYSNDEMTAHGFRGMASTILNEHGFPPDIIERQLAHVERSSVRSAYNHAEYLPQRREMMQWWADFLFPETPPS
jgi:integrase